MKALERASVDKQDVRQMRDAELAELGVRIINRKDVVLECRRCGENWIPELDATGRLPGRYWVCPAKCNE